MDPSNPEIVLEVPPYLQVHKNGTIERFAGTEVAPAGFDSETNVVSKDILIIPETGVTARFYYPNSAAKTTKLPLVFYLHGGAFCISSPSDPLYHNPLNRLVAESNVVAVSVDYRLAPEHPLPAAYEDSWAALKWVASHASEHDDGEGEGCGNLLRDRVDFRKCSWQGIVQGLTWVTTWR
uniref:Alpha/beta hydrolase fold-3 domain-containing protein n=1 Tax=Lotus japonicus TaxID=34305 RepID=I3SFX1_LOTJA|nr:unknown [Lotus japonicus]